MGAGRACRPQLCLPCSLLMRSFGALALCCRRSTRQLGPDVAQRRVLPGHFHAAAVLVLPVLMQYCLGMCVPRRCTASACRRARCTCGMPPWSPPTPCCCSGARSRWATVHLVLLESVGRARRSCCAQHLSILSDISVLCCVYTFDSTPVGACACLDVRTPWHATRADPRMRI